MNLETILDQSRKVTRMPDYGELCSGTKSRLPKKMRQVVYEVRSDPNNGLGTLGKC
jgi:hypothetical protein